MPLYLGEASTKRRKQVIGAIAAVLILSFLIAFWQDIFNFLAILFNLKEIIFNHRSLLEWATPIQRNALLILSYTCGLGFLGVFLFWLILLAGQAILPVDGFVENYRTAWHLLLYMLRLHGPAVFVRDGQVLATKEDVREGPGIAVVDFNSAIVLESSPPLPGINRIVLSFLHSMLMLVGLAEKTVSPRTAGPGIVFTGRGEKIRGSVDLRKQFRMQKDITAYARDGIEVFANVFSIFTIGQPADILQVTYSGDPRPEFLRVVVLERVSDTHLRVTNLLDELDINDRDEIHRYIQTQFYHHNHPLQPYSDPVDTNTQPQFDPRRVFAAVFSQARADRDTVLPWSELPSRVAAGIFREILSQINYDQMYQIKEPVAIPLARSRNRLRLEMRNNGILSYRVLLHSSRQPLERHKVYLRSELMVSDVKPLVTSKILRDRGIKVITASFGDILPVNEAIYLHRLESWKATWQRDTEIVGAEKDLEAMRIRSRARAMAQQDIVNNINSILQQTDISQEVLALRVLQALETLAADTTTKELLPGGTLDVMKAARD
jgi:hypothetical protein